MKTNIAMKTGRMLRKVSSRNRGNKKALAERASAREP